MCCRTHFVSAVHGQPYGSQHHPSTNAEGLKARCLPALMILPSGWAPIDYSWKQSSRRSCSAAHNVRSIDYPVSHFLCAAVLTLRYPSLVTWAHGSITDSPCQSSSSRSLPDANSYVAFRSPSQATGCGTCIITVGLLQRSPCWAAPANQLCRLQSVLHVTARLIYGARQGNHVTPLLPVPECMEFKLSVPMYQCMNICQRTSC